MKTATLNISNQFEPIVSNPIESTETIEVITLLISNTSSSDSNVDVVVERTNQSSSSSVEYYYALKSGLICPHKTLSVFLSKDFGIYLEPGDSLKIKSDTSGDVDAVCSYIFGTTDSEYESSSVSGNSSSSSVFINYSSSSSDDQTNQEVSSSSLESLGNLWGWGYNNQGQLGNGSVSLSETNPIQIGNDTWKFIAGNYTVLGIKNDDTLWGWGENANFAIGDGTNTDRSSPVQIGSDAWKKISTSVTHSIGIKNNNTLWAWGGNANGRTGLGISGGGIEPYFTTTPTQIGSDFWSDVSVGTQSVAIKSDGTLWAWGPNNIGQVGDGTNTERTIPVQISSDTWLKISCGTFHTLAIKSDGTLWAWGLNDYGQLGDGTNTNKNSPVQIGSDTWTAIAGGDKYSLGIKSDGTLWAWGLNETFDVPMGVLGDGTNINRDTPVQIGGDTWISIIAGDQSSVGIKSDGTLWSWGWNEYGQLGDGTTTDRNSPVQIGNSTWSNIFGTQGSTFFGFLSS